VNRVLISRTKLDQDIWQRLKVMAAQMGTNREELMNTVLRKFVEGFDVKLVKKTQKRGEGRSYFDSG